MPHGDRVRWLADLAPEELLSEARRGGHAKWTTPCLLRAVGLRTLNACYIPPGIDRSEVCCAAHQFAKKYNVDRLLVRSDGGSEIGQYYRGGHSLAVMDATAIASRLHESGRAVLFMEPTNRFINQLSVNLLATRPGTLVIEVLGPGYDVSDLNRGGIRPQVTLTASRMNWDQFETLQRSDLAISCDMSSRSEQFRRRQRLEFVAKQCLPSLGVEVGQAPIETAAKWLQDKGYVGLWCDWRPHITLAQLRAWHEGCFMLGMLHHNRNWHAICCSASDLGDGRFVFWDVVDASSKFSSRTTC